VAADPAVLVAGVALLLFCLAAMRILRPPGEPEVAQRGQVASPFLAPHTSFTVVLPVGPRDEVIERAIDRLVQARYPVALLEVVVVCSGADLVAAQTARSKVEALRRRGTTNVEVLVVDPVAEAGRLALDVASCRARHEVVTILDVDVEIHPDIFHVVNTTMLDEAAAVVGVRLINGPLDSRSAPQVPECPGACTTVFIRRDALTLVGGWQEHISSQRGGCAPETWSPPGRFRDGEVWVLEPADEEGASQPFALVTASAVSFGGQRHEPSGRFGVGA
jgi:hypothetical protein